jgi:hypothetical protein
MTSNLTPKLPLPLTSLYHADIGIEVNDKPMKPGSDNWLTPNDIYDHSGIGSSSATKPGTINLSPPVITEEWIPERPNSVTVHVMRVVR